MAAIAPRLGLRENAGQFTLLVLVNAFVGAMVGLERTLLPVIAEAEFHLVARTAMLLFIVAFGISKALTNYVAGRLSDRFGRRHVLIAGWIVAIPVPFLLMWAPSWNWILAANVLLGISQGLTWSTTVIMKIDLVGARRRGLAMGLNEFAGYFAVALSALATGWVAAQSGLRPEPFYLGVVYVIAGLALSIWAVRETRHFVGLETATTASDPAPVISQRDLFWRVSLSDRNLSSVSQAGLVNNLNDGMAWGLFPLVFAASGASLAQIAALAALYPAVWGVTQIVTGALSDRIGRKGLIVWGMWVQACGIAMTAAGSQLLTFACGAVLLGVGTAMVYPTLLAAIGDVARPEWRASAVGIYRLWRDLGYAVGALMAGLAADAMGLTFAVYLVASVTFASGVLAAVRMTETRPNATLQTHQGDSRPMSPSSAPDRLLLVYDGDSGLAAMLLDVVKKAVGKEDCPLCEIVYSPIGKRSECRQYEARFGLPVEEWHRDRIQAAWHLAPVDLPCIVARSGESIPAVLVTRAQIVASGHSVAALEATVREALLARDVG